jgi:4-hydroxy-4-methyl-2-oxoglutarate aldolase
MKAEMKDPHIDYLKTVDTPTLSNAIEMLKVRPQSEGFTPISIRCQFPELGRMVGYAVTAHVESMNKGPIDWNIFLELYEAVAKSPKPAVVVFQEVGPHPDFAVHAGEVMTTIFNRLGAVGLVSDCGVRDIPEVRAMKFHYFARGVAASHSYSRIVRVGVPVQVQGLMIRPGEILHGDENGLITVPNEGIEKLPEAVNQIQARERDLMQFVRGGDFTLEKLKGRILE